MRRVFSFIGIHFFIIGLCGHMSLPGHVMAAVPDLPEDSLRSYADEVVVVKIERLFKRDLAGKGYRKIEGVLAFKVLEVEKGTALKVGETAYARYWYMAGKMPASMAGSSGHRTHLLKESASVRLFLKIKDGVRSLVFPNGATAVKAAGVSKAQKALINDEALASALVGEWKLVKAENTPKVSQFLLRLDADLNFKASMTREGKTVTTRGDYGINDGHLIHMTEGIASTSRCEIGSDGLLTLSDLDSKVKFVFKKKGK